MINGLVLEPDGVQWMQFTEWSSANMHRAGALTYGIEVGGCSEMAVSWSAAAEPVIHSLTTPSEADEMTIRAAISFVHDAQLDAVWKIYGDRHDKSEPTLIMFVCCRFTSEFIQDGIKKALLRHAQQGASLPQ
ncbi:MULTISPECIES: hypothetical protein [unclassified Sphingobium]|uniref:hypothetical protein n=1 Tax=unclassified Sphingobium TaxID=2611147 RepID=UPI002224BBE4|nr:MULTISPECIES: hypothetical protein [unclassified Sphingobium]MCW2412951.1 hypothetical protein [Sphingobium sp. B8D3D]MCW2414751.1 hypothetical protein [Sphingobium sp. B8D3A]